MGKARRGIMRCLLTGSLVATGASALVPASGASPAGAASAATSPLFSSGTPGQYSVAVPAGITALVISATGGSGGTSTYAGGEGAVVSAIAPVVPGDTLTVTVGADGSGAGAGGTGMGTGGAGGVGTSSGGGGGGGSSVVDGTVHLATAGGGGGGSLYGPGGNADQNGTGYNGGEGWAGTLTGPGVSGHQNSCSGFGFGTSGVGPDGGTGDSGGGGGGYFGGGAGCYGGGGGGSSFPAPATKWDTTGTPQVTISAPFLIATKALPAATAGVRYPAQQLQAANVGISTPPATTTLKWKKVTLAKGLTLSASGLLAGTPAASGGTPTSVTVQVTETVVTLNGTTKIRTKTVVRATIPL